MICHPLPILQDKIENYTTVCRLVGDLSQIPKRDVNSRDGKTYYAVRYDVVLHFGLTELKGQLRWLEGVSGRVGTSDCDCER
jgi:hypothetical protein